MVWLIVLLIFAVVAGNLMWLMPSRRERQQMVFRQAAIVRGMKVGEVRVDELPEVCDRQERWMTYALAVGHRSDVHHPVVLRRTNRGWELPDELNAGALGERLGELPEGLVQIALKQMSVVALWNERGEKDAVDQIHAALSALKDVSF